MKEIKKKENDKEREIILEEAKEIASKSKDED